jgi:hypothetical protein
MTVSRFRRWLPRVPSAPVPLESEDTELPNSQCATVQNIEATTPTSESEDEIEVPVAGPHGNLGHGDDDVTAKSGAAVRRKPGGYDSRIEQILYEYPDLPILITEAGKSVESGGRYIVYTIRTGVRQTSFKYFVDVSPFSRD